MVDFTNPPTSTPGIFQDDLILFTAIKTALSDIRANPNYIYDIANQILTDPYTDKSYGKAEVQKFLAFMKKEIFVVMAHRVDDHVKFPCITIELNGGSEDQAKAGLGDGFETRNVTPEEFLGSYQQPQKILGPVTPLAVIPQTGQVTFGPDVDLTNVFEGQFVYDEVNDVAYVIETVLDEENLIITIPQGKVPNLNGCTIRPNTNNFIQTRKFLYFWNNYTLGVHTTDAVDTMYLFQILMFILLKYKQTLFEARGFEVGTIAYDGLTRSAPEDPNVLWHRQITLRGRVGMSWPDTTDKGIQGIAPTITIDGMQSPASLLPEVDMQGWRGSLDPIDPVDDE
jgi:hypothetical protein